MGNSQGKPVVFTDEVNLGHFKLLRVVGKGAFGKVRIVERKDTGLTFALKYIRKDEVVRSESVRNIIRERRMLEHLNHPFLCNLRYSFQDIEYLYIVVDLMNGGDLRFHISRKAFTEETVRFWIAELGCALRYIHQQGIVHRDVKPDNVLLDERGHVHLADFNVASDFTPGKMLTSRSGTLAYLAPEVYHGRGYTSAVDWWSLGVTFFECIYNRRPFKGHTHEKLATEIGSGTVLFPATQPPVSSLCLQAMAALMERDPYKRIGGHEFSTFAEHAFFREIDFEALERKEIDPIFVPSSEKTNFDATYDLEELLLEEAPLEARARRQRPREQLKDDASTKEIRADELHRMIESLFEPFDYTQTTYVIPTFRELPFPHPHPHPRTSRLTLASRYVASDSEASAGSPDVLQSSSRSKSSTEEAAATTAPNRAQIPRSASGSPPLPHAELDVTSAGPQIRPRQDHEQAHSVSTTAAAAPPRAVTRLRERSGRGSRSASMAGPAPDETGSWSELSEAGAGDGGGGKAEGKGKASVLGFLRGRHGRGQSPKPQERGVLGREGARHILS
ncbi:MAG: hypothetical protein M1832_006227 [Thelocarpon impressellum]|nr:MAG: hypothetical protein M1832_006227 [Thelocarpon impressellum]